MGRALQARLGAAAISIVVVAGTAAAVGVTQATPAGAGATNEIFVENTDGGAPNANGSCSLREAVLAAQGTATGTDCEAGSVGAGDVIKLAGSVTLPATINVTGGSLSYGDSGASSLTIEGPVDVDGAPLLTIDGTGLGFPILFGDGSDSLDVTNVILQNGSSNIHGGAINASSGDVTATNAQFLDNSAPGNGGAILGSAVTVIDSLFSGNDATGALGPGNGNGGAISAAGIVSVTNTDFTGNTAAGSGGAVNGSGAVTIAGDSDFTDNTSSDHGGAIESGGSVTLNGTGAFTDNDTTGQGGAIDAVSVTVNDGIDFSDNDALGGSGAGGCIDATTITVNTGGSVFNNNTSGQAGGCLSGATMSVTDATFTANDATGNRGGAIIINGSSTVTITNSVFGGATPGQENSASVGGGAIATIASPTSVSVSSSTFVRNQGGTVGGAIAFLPSTESTELSVDDSTFDRNGASGSGGAIMVDQGALTVTQSTFVDNASGNGGGVAVEAKTGARPRGSIENSTFFSNDSSLAGAAIYTDFEVTDFGFAIRSVTASGNNADGDVVISNVGEDVVSLSSTIIEKSVNAIAQCAGTIGDGGYNLKDDSAADGTCPFGGTNLADADPELQTSLTDNGGPTKTLRPTSFASPVVDAIPTGDCPTAEDQRGFGRPSLGGCDVGAVELQASVVSGTIKDLVAPKGTGAAFGTTALSGVGACPSGNPTCTPDTTAFANAAGAYSIGLEPGTWVLIPFYCKSTSQAACGWGSANVSKGPASAPITLDLEEAPTTNVNLNVGFRPDIQARLSTLPAFYDLDQYPTSAIARTGIRKSATVRYVIRMQNDGNASDTIRLKAALAGPTSTHIVRFKDGSTLIGGVTTTGKTFTIAPGGRKDVTVEITARSTSVVRKTLVVALTAYSTNQSPGAKLDSVQVWATRI
jgi:CSLREA domain-containing protein